MIKHTTITIEVGTNFNISDEEFKKEILLAETRMNTNSKLRFHIIDNMLNIVPIKGYENLEDKTDINTDG